MRKNLKHIDIYRITTIDLQEGLFRVNIGPKEFLFFDIIRDEGVTYSNIRVEKNGTSGEITVDLVRFVRAMVFTEEEFLNGEIKESEEILAGCEVVKLIHREKNRYITSSPAIATKYLPATGHRESRIKVAHGSLSLIFPANEVGFHSNDLQQHISAARKFIKQKNLRWGFNILNIASLNEGYVFVMQEPYNYVDFSDITEAQNTENELKPL